MKKFSLCFILLLLSVLLMQTTAFAASDTTVDKIEYTAELRTDGTAYITEVWTVTTGDTPESFSRRIESPSDEFESFREISELAVSVDGVICSPATADFSGNDTYTLTNDENGYLIGWNLESKNTTHIYTLRYLKHGAVKLYDGSAYFYTTVVNENDTYGVCHNITVSILTQNRCFSENFTVVESGSLAGKKSDSSIVFSADNAAGLVKVAISVPAGTFDASSLTSLDREENPFDIAAIAVCLCSIIIVVSAAFYVVYRKKFFRNKWEKKCLKKVHRESSYEAQSGIFEHLSPAVIMNIVSEKTASEADKFIVTVLDLVKRGYIVPSAEGFSASLSSDCDTVNRPIDKNEKYIIDMFSDGKWQTVLSRPKRFYAVAEKFSRSVPFVSPFFMFSSENRKIVHRCFEMKLAALYHEFIMPEEISDDMFRNGKYSSEDLLVSLFNEYELALNANLDKNNADKYKYNLFVLRELYAEGKELVIAEEVRRQMQKKQGKGKTVNNDGSDTQ